MRTESHLMQRHAVVSRGQCAIMASPEACHTRLRRSLLELSPNALRTGRQEKTNGKRRHESWEVCPAFKQAGANVNVLKGSQLLQPAYRMQRVIYGKGIYGKGEQTRPKEIHQLPRTSRTAVMSDGPKSPLKQVQTDAHQPSATTHPTASSWATHDHNISTASPDSTTAGFLSS